MAKQEPDYEAMSIEDLEAAIHALGEERLAIAERQRAAHRVLNRKLTEQSAARKLESMSSAERAALRQQLNAQGVESGEQFGDIGQ